MSEMHPTDVHRHARLATIYIDGAITQAAGAVAFLSCGEQGYADAIACFQRAALMWRDATIKMRAIRDGISAAESLASAAIEYRQQRERADA